METAPFLQNVRVSGEISNLNYNSSGHIYFSIKDDAAQISAVMFRAQASKLKLKLESGQKILATGNVSVYEPRGQYQLICDTIEIEGMGKLFEAFLILKEKLNEEGLFDVRHKKIIPKYPQKIAIITSETGAVLHDITNTLSRRFPMIQVVLIPSLVQGETAAPALIRALKMADEIPDLDTIIIARGGGSLEDLWCFNNEVLVRCIFDLQTPIISAIGHETDFTLCDFVADLRAPTPTAAAEMVAPDYSELKENLEKTKQIFKSKLSMLLNMKEQKLDDYQERVNRGISRLVDQKTNTIAFLEQAIKHADFRTQLERGYTITLKNGKRITQASDIQLNDEIETIYKWGRSTSKIIKNGEN